jgi:hypothetical protein
MNVRGIGAEASVAMATSNWLGSFLQLCGLSESTKKASSGDMQRAWLGFGFGFSRSLAGQSVEGFRCSRAYYLVRRSLRWFYQKKSFPMESRHSRERQRI